MQRFLKIGKIMKRQVFALISIFFALCTVEAQDFRAEMLRAERENDTIKQKQILTEWEKVNSNDPYLYGYYFDYYYSRAWNAKDSLTTEKPVNKKYYEIPDSTGKIVAYLVKASVDEDLLKQAMKKIDEGIHKFPNNMDLRQMKIYALAAELEDWNTFEKEMISVIDYSNVINNKWETTSPNYGERDFVANMLDYTELLLWSANANDYKTEDSIKIQQVIKICDELQRFYPDNVEVLVLLSSAYLTNYETEKALDYLKKAERIEPNNELVLLNLANAFLKSGDKQMAIEYCERVSNNENSTSYAKQQAKEFMDSIK